MASFPLPTSSYQYRPLKKGLAGWDILALQTALKGAGHNLVLDGQFGAQTEAAVQLWQEGMLLTADRIAGVLTQRSLALKLGEGVRNRHRLPIKLLMGQIENESGYLLGNHPARYEDGSYDLGVAQINNKQRGLPVAQCFDVPFALDLLGAQVRKVHDRYLAAPLREGFSRVTNARAWELAAGSWNRPAHTAYLAGMRTTDSVAPAAEGPLSDRQIDWIEDYCDRVLTYAQAYYRERNWPT